MKDTTLIFERESTQNECATLDHLVALSQISPSVRRTVHNLFVCSFVFDTWLKKSLGLADKNS